MKINQKIKLDNAGCIWFTGYSGSGKSTIARILQNEFHKLGINAFVLDGDQLRQGLNRDLQYTREDRRENIRRVAEVAKLMVDAGLVVLVALISPYKTEREKARSLFNEREFLEVFVDTPFEVCEKRDVKGLYEKARRGILRDFTGIDDVYEQPSTPEVHLETERGSPEEMASIVLSKYLTSVKSLTLF